MIAYMVCYFSVKTGDCVILKDANSKYIRAKALPIRYDVFASRVNRRYWQLIYAGPGSFHFARR